MSNPTLGVHPRFRSRGQGLTLGIVNRNVAYLGHDGMEPGYPRFKGRNRFAGFGFKEYGNGFKIDGRRLKLSCIGRIAVRWHRPIEGKIKTCRVYCRAGRWFASFACEVEKPEPLPKTGEAIGVDVGLLRLATLSTTPQRKGIEITPLRLRSSLERPQSARTWP